MPAAVDAVVELVERDLLVLAHLVANDEARERIGRRAFGMVDARNLIDDRLKRLQNGLLDFGGRGTRQNDLHECARHRDLRIFLARRRQHRPQAEDDAAENDDRGELGVDEEL